VPLISVIIPTCNRQQQLSYCLASLAPHVQHADAELYEVIVSDDGNDSAKLLVETDFPFAQWVKGPIKGPAANRNYGASFAKGQWLVFIDDDCMAYNNLMQTYAKIFQTIRDEIGAVEGAVVGIETRTRYDQQAPINIDGGNFWSANIAVRKTLFDQIGGFDEAFVIPCLEDEDIYIRLMQQSKVFFARDAVVIHPWRIGTIEKRFQAIIGAHAYFYRKHQQQSMLDRLQRSYIFLREFARNTYHLIKYRFRGGDAYPYQVYLYWKLIFV
jgi:glycosyltransferase involved in cell wall biosynthesis